MSQNNRNVAELGNRAESELDTIRSEIAKLKKAFGDMAMLVLPASMRNFCECGKLACRTITAVKPRATVAEHFKLCEECKLPEGCLVVGTVELSPSERESARLANSIGCRHQ